MIIQIYPQHCIACGLCHTYNTLFDYDEDGLVCFEGGGTQRTLPTDASLLQAAKECPTKAIQLTASQDQD
ncbi:MAG: ferredoxin [Streptococcaceae bacterium]|nr:ferredoxin [Streptococcaceae bacterium]